MNDVLKQNRNNNTNNKRRITQLHCFNTCLSSSYVIIFSSHDNYHREE